MQQAKRPPTTTPPPASGPIPGQTLAEENARVLALVAAREHRESCQRAADLLLELAVRLEAEVAEADNKNENVETTYVTLFLDNMRWLFGVLEKSGDDFDDALGEAVPNWSKKARQVQQ